MIIESKLKIFIVLKLLGLLPVLQSKSFFTVTKQFHSHETFSRSQNSSTVKEQFHSHGKFSAKQRIKILRLKKCKNEITGV